MTAKFAFSFLTLIREDLPWKASMSFEDFCLFNLFGHCKFGLYCDKLHVMKTCTNVHCNIDSCTFRHPPVCKFFSTFGDCKFQDDCSFLHVIPTDKLASAQKEIDVLKSEIGLLEKNLLSIQNKFENMETLEKRTEEILSKIKIFYK